MTRLSRDRYAELYGPTRGDRFRLADTSLTCEVERDFTVPGEEAVAGPAGTVRDGMAQAAHGERPSPDLVITNAVLMDPVLGVIKADIGVRDGRIVAIGKAGNPDVMDRVNPELVIGPGTEIVVGEHLLATPGGVDAAVPAAPPAAAAWPAGVTTVLCGGGPEAGGVAYVARTLRAAERVPVNVGVLGTGSASRPDALREQLEAGACGLVDGEDRGATPATIGCALRVADEYDVQVALHAGAGNESGALDAVLAAIAGRAVQTFHSGDAAEGLRVASCPNVLPSSSATTAPACVLHDEGVLSLAGGRGGDGAVRMFQTASRMRDARGPLDGDEEGRNDNARILRYLAKLTINPARAYGIAAEVGSLEPGKLADIVLWQIPFFGVRPRLLVKGGAVWRPGGGGAADPTCVTFMSRAAADMGVDGRLGLRRPVAPVSGCRRAGKADMVRNDRTPEVAVDPDTHEVRIDGELATAPPVRGLPMTRLYALF